MNPSIVRSRWAAIGAAVAVTIGAGGIGLVSATSPADATAYIPIEPCRVADTRNVPEFNVGPRNTPIGAMETHVITAHGDNGECTGIPTSATGLQLNVTSLNATAGTFLAIWGSGDQPNASSLNPQPGQPPIPNAVTTGLTPAGAFNVYNQAGTVDVIVDIVGFYSDHDHDDRYYTETEVDAALADKANSTDVYSKSESDGKYLARSQDSHAAIYGENSSAAVGAADVVVGSLTVDTPASGYVVVNATAYLQNGSGSAARVRCSVSTDMTRDSAALQIVDVPDGDWDDVAATRGFEIDKSVFSSPSESTYFYVCDTATGSLNVNDVHMTAIFIPDPDAFGGVVIGTLSDKAASTEGE